MENEFAKHETDYINRYEKMGYTDAYRFADGCLKGLTSKVDYDAKDVTIVKEHRYEGMSNPSDMSILYVLETSDGRKGTLLAAFSPTADGSVHVFMNSVPDVNKKNLNLLPPDAKK